MNTPEDIHLYDEEISLLEKKIQALPKNQPVIAFYGSSSVRLWLNMARDLDPMPLINLGFGGSSYWWCLHHFDRLFNKTWEPKEMVLYIGDNDLGHGSTYHEVIEGYRSMKKKIRQRYPDMMIHYISVKPSPLRDYLIPTIKAVNKTIQEDVDTDDQMRYINVFDGMLDGNNPNTSYYLSDLLHLNRRGYQVWKGIVRAHFGLDVEG